MITFGFIFLVSFLHAKECGMNQVKNRIAVFDALIEGVKRNPRCVESRKMLNVTQREFEALVETIFSKADVKPVEIAFINLQRSKIEKAQKTACEKSLRKANRMKMKLKTKILEAKICQHEQSREKKPMMKQIFF